MYINVRCKGGGLVSIVGFRCTSTSWVMWERSAKGVGGNRMHVADLRKIHLMIING